MVKIKVCRDCGETKSHENFRRDMRSKGMIAEACTACEAGTRYKVAAARRLRCSRVKAATTEKVDRAAIIARDNGICYLCGAKPQGRDLTLDHVVPVARGGSHSSDNLRVACRPCNSRKGIKLISTAGGG